MTVEAKHLVQEFGTLPDTAKREVLTELLRMSRYLDYPEMGEEELASAADALFLEYDRREAAE